MIFAVMAEMENAGTGFADQVCSSLKFLVSKALQQIGLPQEAPCLAVSSLFLFISHAPYSCPVFCLSLLAMNLTGHDRSMLGFEEHSILLAMYLSAFALCASAHQPCPVSIPSWVMGHTDLTPRLVSTHGCCGWGSGARPVIFGLARRTPRGGARRKTSVWIRFV